MSEENKTTGEILRDIRNALSFLKPLITLNETLQHIEKKELNIKELEANEQTLEARIKNLDSQLKEKRDLSISQEDTLKNRLARVKDECATETIRLTNDLENFRATCDGRRLQISAELQDYEDAAKKAKEKIDEGILELNNEYNTLKIKVSGLKEAIESLDG